jgi:site-specific DNA-methyltransferase (adenine-specific)
LGASRRTRFAKSAALRHTANRNRAALFMTNQLYYGDNLGVLREHIADASVDLVYLDPPFNSNATYNVLFKAPDGVQSQAQIEAFDDTWHWTESAENAYWEVLHGPNTNAAEMLKAMRGFLGENEMMAYLLFLSLAIT